MFAFDRETATVLAVIVCIAASVYMYRELRGSKEEITKITSFLDKVKEEEKAIYGTTGTNETSGTTE